MEKILNWIKEHRKLTATLIIAIVFLPIIIIHLLFKFYSNCYWIEAEWEAGEVLGYFGDVLSFIGTVVLGYIAIAQAEKANQLSGELLKVEKNRIKPCFDISSSQLYKIFLAQDMYGKLAELDRSNVIIMDLLCKKNPRTGIVTDSALIELDVFNSGFSDIRRIMVKSASFYLAVREPFELENKKIAIMSGNDSLKVGESRKLYIHVKREVATDEELDSRWYEENTNKLMPHMEFEFELETVTGILYIEKIICGSGWDISMENTKYTTTRSIGVTEISVKEKN